MTSPQELSEREFVNWLHEQLHEDPRDEDDLCAAFFDQFSIPVERLVEFLRSSKYFRRTGTEGKWVWMISANREDDVRDFLAE